MPLLCESFHASHPAFCLLLQSIGLSFRHIMAPFPPAVMLERAVFTQDDLVAPGIVAICGLNIILVALFVVGRLYSNLALSRSLHLDDCESSSPGQASKTWLTSFRCQPRCNSSFLHVQRNYVCKYVDSGLLGISLIFRSTRSITVIRL